MAKGMYRKPEPLPIRATVSYKEMSFSPMQMDLMRRVKRIVTSEAALYIDQRPFNSLVKRGFISRTANGFVISARGSMAMEQAANVSVLRETARPQLGKYVQLLQQARAMRGAA